MSLSVAEERIRRLMTRLAANEHRTRVVEDRILRARQDLAGFYQVGAGRGCTTTIEGKIVGGDNVLPLPGSTIQVTGHASAIDYGTFLSVDGTYSIAIILDASDASLDLVITGPGPRFTAKPPVTVSVMKCDINPLANIRAQPATGYYYLSGPETCPYPIGETLNYVHSLHGSGTMIFTSSPSWLTPCLDVTSFAAGSCASVNTILRIVMLQTMNLIFGYHNTSGLPCPTAAVCPTGTTANGNLTATITAKQCPSLTDNFDITYTIAGGTEPWFHGPADQTFRLFEP